MLMVQKYHKKKYAMWAKDLWKAILSRKIVIFLCIETWMENFFICSHTTSSSLYIHTRNTIIFICRVYILETCIPQFSVTAQSVVHYFYIYLICLHIIFAIGLKKLLYCHIFFRLIAKIIYQIAVDELRNN